MHRMEDVEAVTREEQHMEKERNTILGFLAARDHLLGWNYVTQDVRKALELASECEHPEAVWLNSLLGMAIETAEEAKRVFLEHEDDARALGYAGESKSLFCCFVVALLFS
jgi:hypothetical protein